MVSVENCSNFFVVRDWKKGKTERSNPSGSSNLFYRVNNVIEVWNWITNFNLKSTNGIYFNLPFTNRVYKCCQINFGYNNWLFIFQKK